MNLNIVISFLIGGLLLLAILALNGRVLQNSGQAVLNMSAKKTVETVNEIIQHDFVRLGYNCPAAVQTAEPNKITFCADLDNDGDDDDAKLITWQANSSNSISSTENPDDYLLIRSGPEIGTSRFSVTDFNITYYDIDGSEADDASDVHIISIKMMTESPVKYGNGSYAKAVLNKTFTPPNLNLAAMQ